MRQRQRVRVDAPSRVVRASDEPPPPSFAETMAKVGAPTSVQGQQTRRDETPAPPAPTSNQPPSGQTMLWNDETKKFVNAGEPATKLDDPCLQGLTITPGEVISRIDKARGRGGRLDLTGIGLTKVPDEVWTMTDLTDLQLSNNKITRIPDDVGNLRELERLGLAGNRLTEIPRGIGGCECLEGLWAHGNLIGTVPDTIGDCGRLRHLMLAGNRVRRLPDSIGDCKYLEELSFPGNELESLPETIGGAYMLRVIDVHGNKITKLPDGVAKLKSLEELSAQGNLLTSIPEDVGDMRRLVRLNVAENKLESLPKGLGDAAMMTTLWCYGNPRTHVAADVAREERVAAGGVVRRVRVPRRDQRAGVGRGGAGAERRDRRDDRAGPRAVHPRGLPRQGGDGERRERGGRSRVRSPPRLHLRDRRRGGRRRDKHPGGYFKHVRWSENTDAPVLIVAYGSAPGVPNWGGLLKKLRRDLLVRGKNCAGGAGAEAAAAVDAAAAGYDVLYVADTTRSWYHGEARCTNDVDGARVARAGDRRRRTVRAGVEPRGFDGRERGASLRRRRGSLPRVLPPG